MSVNELVEWVAEFMMVRCGDCPHEEHFNNDCPYLDEDICLWQRDLTKQILSHHKIVFLEDDQSIPDGVFTTAGCSSNLGLVEHMFKAGFRKVTSLAEAIKTMEEK
uniref:Uncharacterized protein n=1 Tax=viral metagenome TaxID=1070528 RepID=A0A6H2A3N0_9ZZZZ